MKTSTPLIARFFVSFLMKQTLVAEIGKKKFKNSIAANFFCWRTWSINCRSKKIGFPSHVIISLIIQMFFLNTKRCPHLFENVCSHESVIDAPFLILKYWNLMEIVIKLSTVILMFVFLSFSRCLHTVSWQFNGEPKGKQRGATCCFLWTLIASATFCVITLSSPSFIMVIMYATLHFIPPSFSWWRTCWRRCQPCSARAERPIVPSARRSKQPSSSCRPLGAVSPFFRPSCRRWGPEHCSRGKTLTSAQARR